MNSEWLKEAHKTGQQMLMALADVERRTGVSLLDKELSYRYNREGFAGLDKRQLDALDHVAERFDFAQTANRLLNTPPFSSDGQPTDDDL
jgi:hypothetical protein